LYAAEINRRQPALLLLLLDQSYSMSERWGEHGKSKAEMLALTVNRLLTDAVLQCSKGDDRIHDYFEIGVIGYGADVQPILHGTDSSRPVLPISEIGRNPRRVDRVKRKVSDGAGGLVEVELSLPVWVDPVTSGPTPMTQALEAAAAIVADWCARHPASFPPIVINVTDGASTDGDPAEAARAVRSARTDDGDVLLFNLHLSASASNEIAFPSTAEGLQDQYAAQLFAMSSALPSVMAEAASACGYAVRTGARGFLFNAGTSTVIEFLDIGTRAVTPTGLKELTAANSTT
jgi:hypothetical protein